MSGLVTMVARAAEWATTTREEVTNQMPALVRREGEGVMGQMHGERGGGVGRVRERERRERERAQTTCLAHHSRERCRQEGSHLMHALKQAEAYTTSRPSQARLPEPSQ